MTLIELLIVLGLMAAIASVALTTLDSMGDRTRADTTRNRLDMIEKAIVGDGLEPGRFVSDMGRLPVVHDDIPDPDDPTGSTIRNTVEGEGLIELWYGMNREYDYEQMEWILFNGFDMSSGTPSEPFYDTLHASGGTFAPCESTAASPTGLFDPDGFSERFPNISAYTSSTNYGVRVQIPGGWHGPYLQVNERLFDGFGNALRMTNAIDALRPDLYGMSPSDWHGDGNIEMSPADTTVALADGEPIIGIASLGRDGGLGDTDWADVDDVRFLEGAEAKAATATLILSLKAHSPDGWVTPEKDEAPAFDTVLSKTSGVDVLEEGRIYRLLVDPELSTSTFNLESVGDAAAWPDDAIVRNEEETVSATEFAKYTWLRLKDSPYMNRMRVILFFPFADPDFASDPNLLIDGASVALGAMRIRRIAAWYDWRLVNSGGETDVEEQGCIDSEYLFFGNPVCIGNAAGREIEFQWTEAHTVEIRNLPPGTRKFFTYGYYTSNDSDILNAHSCGLQTINLKPGVNHITVYLNQPL